MIIDLHSHPCTLSTGEQRVPVYQVTDADIASLNFYAAFNRWITRHWKRHLPGSECAVLDLIYDRTVGWGKRWERISLRHFEHGFDHALTHCAHSGTGLRQQTITTALRSLVKRGTVLIDKQGEKCAPKFAVNFNWSPSMRVPLYADAMPTLKLSKHHKKPAETSPIFRDVIPNFQGSKRENEKEDGSMLASQAGGSKDRFDSIVKEIVDSGRAKAAKLAASQKQSPSSLELGWRRAWASAFPGIPPIAWKQREGFAVLSWCRRYSKNNPSLTATFPVLLAWVVQRWPLIMREQFRTMRGAPEFPTPGFAVKFSDRFEATFLKRAEIEKRASMTSRDEAVAKARGAGMSEEAAEREADERLGLAEQKEALSRERRRLAVQQAAVPLLSPLMVMGGRPSLKSTAKPKVTLAALMEQAGDDFNPYEAAEGEG